MNLFRGWLLVLGLVMAASCVSETPAYTGPDDTDTGGDDTGDDRDFTQRCENYCEDFFEEVIDFEGDFADKIDECTQDSALMDAGLPLDGGIVIPEIKLPESTPEAVMACEQACICRWEELNQDCRQVMNNAVEKLFNCVRLQTCEELTVMPSVNFEDLGSLGSLQTLAGLVRFPCSGVLGDALLSCTLELPALFGCAL